MGIEQIRMNQTKALPPAFQFNWSQMESDLASVVSQRYVNRINWLSETG